MSTQNHEVNFQTGILIVSGLYFNIQEPFDIYLKFPLPESTYFISLEEIISQLKYRFYQ